MFIKTSTLLILLCFVNSTFPLSAETSEELSKPRFLASPAQLTSNQTITKEASLDFLLGFFVEVSPDGSIVDHDEYSPCVQPDDELHKYVQTLIENAIVFANDPTNYRDYNKKITKKIPNLMSKIETTILRSTCEDKIAINFHINLYLKMVEEADIYLQEKWNSPFVHQKVVTYFSTFAKEVSDGNYKHAMTKAYESIDDTIRQ